MRLAFALLCTVASLALHGKAWVGGSLFPGGIWVHVATMVALTLPDRAHAEGRYRWASQLLAGYCGTVFLAVWGLGFCFGNFTYFNVGFSAAWLAVTGSLLLAELSRAKLHLPRISDEIWRFVGNAVLGAIAGALAALPSAWGHPTVLVMVAGLSATLTLLLETRRRRGLEAALGQLFTSFLGAFLASMWLTGLRFPVTPWQALAVATAATLGSAVSSPVLAWLTDTDYCRRLERSYRGPEPE